MVDTQAKPILYTYYRSSCAFRVRIALNIKQIECDYQYVNLKPGADEQYLPAYRELNPQSRVPLFVDGDFTLAQSTAILEYLEERYPSLPLYPKEQESRAQVRQVCNTIACDIQPLNNLAALQHLKQWSLEQSQIDLWYAQWIQRGFAAIEPVLQAFNQYGPYSFGESLSMADVYLIPQVWNALRFNVALDNFPRIQEVYRNGLQVTAVLAATPEKQADAG